MYIKNIELTNYRNFGYLDIALGKKTTLLIGKNGAGKTNLITALKQSLSFIFSKNLKITQYSFVAESGQKVQSFETTDPMRAIDPDGTQNQNGTWPVRIKTTADIGEEKPLEVIFERVSLSEGMKETYSSASIRFWNRYKQLTDLPVLAFYSDAFPHEKVRIGTKIQDKLNSQFGISQADAYYNWDDPRDCCNVWQQYYIMQWKNEKFGNTGRNEKEYIEAIKSCMIGFSKPLEEADENIDFELDDISFVARGKKEVVVLKFKNGMESDFESLPAGFRRAFSLAFDLANRTFILNNRCDSEGIAFIDEIDLHLHPSLAQEILERMKRAFPSMQFIVSTHSPLVLSNFKQDEEDNFVYRIYREEDYSTSIQKVEHSYGIDYNSLLTDLMGTRIRNTVLRKYINDYLYWMSAEEKDLAAMALKQIEELVGPNSELVKKLAAREP